MTPREKNLADALTESVQRTDEELRAIQLARGIIDAHNDLIARHAAEISNLRTQLVDLQAVLDQETRAKLEACEALADLKAFHQGFAEGAERRAASLEARLKLHLLRGE